MGLQLRFQGETIEFQTILALRLPVYGEERDPAELLPITPSQGGTYEFLKFGYRIYPLNTLPLVATEGSGQFIKVVGMAEVAKVCHYNLNEGVETRGLYLIHKLFDQAESDRWLEILRDRGSPQLSIA